MAEAEFQFENMGASPAGKVIVRASGSQGEIALEVEPERILNGIRRAVLWAGGTEADVQVLIERLLAEMDEAMRDGRAEIRWVSL